MNRVSRTLWFVIGYIMLVISPGAPQRLGAANPASATPTGFTGAAVSDTEIQWSWNDTLGETHYELHDDAHNLILFIFADTTSVIESGLTAGTTVSRHLHSSEFGVLSDATPTVNVTVGSRFVDAIRTALINAHLTSTTFDFTPLGAAKTVTTCEVPDEDLLLDELSLIQEMLTEAEDVVLTLDDGCTIRVIIAPHGSDGGAAAPGAVVQNPGEPGGLVQHFTGAPDLKLIAVSGNAGKGADGDDAFDPDKPLGLYHGASGGMGGPIEIEFTDRSTVFAYAGKGGRGGARGFEGNNGDGGDGGTVNLNFDSCNVVLAKGGNGGRAGTIRPLPGGVFPADDGKGGIVQLREVPPNSITLKDGKTPEPE